MGTKTRVETIKAGPAKGCRMILNLSLPKHREMLNGEYESVFYESCYSLKGKVAWDVGAHMGYHSLAMANLGAIVYSFEPGYEAFCRLSENISRNNCNVIPHFYALSDYNGYGCLISNPIVDSDSSGNHLEGVEAPEGNYNNFNNRTIFCATGDFPLQPLRRPDIAKVDVEGAELLVLQGMRGILGYKKPLLMMEIHSHKLLQECNDFLKEYGYDVQVLTEESPKRIFVKAFAS